MIRRFSLALGLAVVTLGLAVPAQADTVSIGQWVHLADAPGPNADGGGGPFLVNVVGSATQWQTFCLEFTEYINFTDNFKVVNISKNAVGGGPGYSAPTGDPLDLRTQAVYHFYRSGNSGWSGADVQNAIWYLEEEKQTLPTGGAIVTWANANAASYNFKGESVWVMNLENANGGRAQDQLFIRPVPEPATLALTGLALGGLVVRRRRQARA